MLAQPRFPHLQSEDDATCPAELLEGLEIMNTKFLMSSELLINSEVNCLELRLQTDFLKLTLQNQEHLRQTVTMPSGDHPAGRLSIFVGQE